MKVIKLDRRTTKFICTKDEKPKKDSSIAIDNPVVVNSIASAMFDLEKCTFKLIIKNADIGQQAAPVNFGLAFADFHITIPVTPN